MKKNTLIALLTLLAVVLGVVLILAGCTTIRTYHPLTVTAVTDTLYRVRGSVTGGHGEKLRFEGWLTPEELESYYVDRYAPAHEVAIDTLKTKF